MARPVNRPCAVCQRDRLHFGLKCFECGTNTVLKPLAEPTAKARMHAKRAGAKAGRKPHAHHHGVAITVSVRTSTAVAT